MYTIFLLKHNKNRYLYNIYFKINNSICQCNSSNKEIRLKKILNFTNAYCF